MNCPYCNKEMEKGFIQSPHEINWSPKKYFCNSSDIHSDMIVLGESNFIKGSSTIAYCCRFCKKIIIDYDE